MSYKCVLSLITAGLMAACSSPVQQQPAEKAQENPAEKPMNQMVKCFEYIKNQDTIRLQTMPMGDNIVGMLVYKLHEKDQNKGMIKGRMHGDTLIAEYLFKSEGVESSRQVAFKKQGEDYIEGYGDVEEKNGKMVFKNISALKYNEAMLLRRMNCQ